MRRPRSNSRASYLAALNGGPCCSECGMSGIADDVLKMLSPAGGTLVDTVQAKAARLESALTIITVLSGIGAATGLVMLVRTWRRS